MHRHALTDEQWKRLEPVLPEQVFGPKATLGDRSFVDAVLYRAKTGIPWRDRRGLWKQIYKALRVKVDKTSSIVDGSNVRAHQDAAGGKGGSTSTVWVVVEEASRQNFTSLPTEKGAHSM